MIPSGLHRKLLLFGFASLTACAKPAPATLVEAVPTGRADIAEIQELTRPFFEGFEVPAPVYAVKTYRLRYRSRDFDGSQAEILAQLVVPDPERPVERPVLAFGSGTTGVADLCAPSLERPELRRWGHYIGNMLAYAGQGFIVVFPDYLGFNDPSRPQRYFSKIAEGQVMLDAVRAVFDFFAEGKERRKVKARPSAAVFIAGYSQGGHAAFAAADLRASYASEVNLTGVLGFGSANDVEALFRDGPTYAPYILYSYEQIYGAVEIDPARYLQERWARSLEADAGRLCVDEFQSYYPADGSKLYQAEFYEALYGGGLTAAFPELHARFEENRSGLSGHALPALIVQGLEDTIVTPVSQSRFVSELCSMGSPVLYLKLPGVRHRYTRAAGFRASLDWMERLARGETPPSDCGGQ